MTTYPMMNIFVSIIQIYYLWIKTKNYIQKKISAEWLILVTCTFLWGWLVKGVTKRKMWWQYATRNYFNSPGINYVFLITSGSDRERKFPHSPSLFAPSNVLCVKLCFLGTIMEAQGCKYFSMCNSPNETYNSSEVCEIFIKCPGTRGLYDARFYYSLERSENKTSFTNFPITRTNVTNELKFY